MKTYTLLIVFLLLCFSAEAQENNLDKALDFYENFETQKADSALSSVNVEKLSLSNHIKYGFIYDNIHETNLSYNLWEKLNQDQFNRLSREGKATLFTQISSSYLNDWDVKNAYEFAGKSMQYAIPLEQCKSVYDFLPHAIMAFAEFGVEKYATSSKRSFAVYDAMKLKNISCSQTQRDIYNAIGLTTTDFIYRDVSIQVQEQNLACLLARKSVNYGSLATTYNNLGQTHINFGYFQKADEYQQKAKEVFDNHLNGQYYYEWYWHMGWLNYELGNYDLFETYTQMASDMIYNNMGADNFDNVLINRVFTEGYLRFGNLDKAAYYLEKTNQFFNNYYRDEFTETHAINQNRYGEFYFQKKQYSQALSHFLNGINLLEQKGEIDNKFYINPLMYIAETYYELGDYDNISIYLQKLKGILKSLPQDLWRVQNLNNRVRLLEIKIGNASQRIPAFQKLINDIEKQDFQEEIMVKTWHDLAQFHFQENQFVLANQTLQKAFDYIQSHVEILVDNNRIPSGIIYELNDLGLKTSYQLQRQDASYKAQFFKYQEMKRAYALKKIMAQKQLQSMAFIPDSILQKENILKNKIAVFKNQIKNASQDVRYEIQETLVTNQNQLKNLNQLIQNQYPKYFALYNPELYQIDKIQQKLAHDTSIVSITTVDNELYVMVINHDAQEIINIKNKDFSQKIQRLNDELNTQNIAEYKKIAHQLYQDLFEPIAQHLKHKILWIPDAELTYLNPEILLSSLNGKDYKSLDYLIHQFEFLRASSVFLAFNDKGKTLQNQNKKAGFAPVFDEEVKTEYKTASAAVDTTYLQLLQQPFTAQIVNKLAKNQRFEPFIKSNATESNFKTKSQNYGIVHLATHTELNPINPMNSKVYFAKNPKDSLNDGELYIYEIYAQKFENDLAFLSACQTAKGFRNIGDEFISLGHSFHYAGVKNLIYTLWNVDEKTSQEISYDFYNQLGESKNYAEVLRKSKLNYIKNASSQLASPYYWAGMVIQSGISNQNSGNSILYWILGGIFIIGMLFFVIRNLKPKT